MQAQEIVNLRAMLASQQLSATASPTTATPVQKKGFAAVVAATTAPSSADSDPYGSYLHTTATDADLELAGLFQPSTHS